MRFICFLRRLRPTRPKAAPQTPTDRAELLLRVKFPCC